MFCATVQILQTLQTLQTLQAHATRHDNRVARRCLTRKNCKVQRALTKKSTGTCLIWKTYIFHLT